MSSNIRRLLGRLLPSGRPHGAVLLVVDDAGWILDEVAQHLIAHAPAVLGCRAVTHEWMGARHCILHFINRVWAWTDSVLDGVHPSNDLIGVWWHGRLDSEDRAMQAAHDRVRRLHGRFRRFQVTCSIARETLLGLGVPAAKIVMLPIGVDLKTFHPPASADIRLAARRTLGVDAATVLVGCFQKDGSGWDEDAEPKLIKGPDIFAEAMIQLRATHQVHVVIPGPARGYLKRRLRDAGVPFSAPGFVSREELPGFYHALDLYVSPSRDEGGPAGVLEAMASGVPVVSTKSGMPADMIATGINGLLVDVEDANALASGAASLIDQPALRASLAAAALLTIQAYDWPIVARRYVTELYEPLRTRPQAR